MKPLIELTEDEYANHIQTKYGKILSDDAKNYWMISPPKGWRLILEDCFDDLLELHESTGQDIKIAQVKSKFARLRIYFDSYNESANAIVRAYEEILKTICEQTGEHGRTYVSPGGWLFVATEEIAKQRNGKLSNLP